MGAGRAALRLVQPVVEQAPVTLFCGHCGEAPELPPRVELASRVCGDCGMGLLLESDAELAPTPADAFLVVDHAMSISALSRRAEEFLGIPEPEAVGRHLKELLTPADTDVPATQSFFTLILLAATGAADPQKIAVRPPDLFGVRYWARVSSCGPSSAALLLLGGMD